jgi:hypothetical protein
MSSKLIVFACALGLLSSAAAVAQTTQPAEDKTTPLDVRAAAAFNSGDYALALPMLEKLAEQSMGDADRFGRIQEQIRVCRQNLGTADAAAGPAEQPDPSQRKPISAPKPGEVLEISIKDLGNFVYDADKGGNIPEDVKKLSGSKLRVRGFMIPMDQADNVTSFAMVPDLFACCFGQPPQVQHTVVATCPPGKSVGYFPDELVVEGTLKVEEKREDGFIVSVFQLDVASVKPAAK